MLGIEAGSQDESEDIQQGYRGRNMAANRGMKRGPDKAHLYVPRTRLEKRGKFVCADPNSPMNCMFSII